MKSQNDKEVRERLVARGAEALTDAELLSLVLPARRGEESVATAERMVESVGGVGPLARLTLSELRQLEGLGMDGAAKVAAAIELGRRVLLAEGEEGANITNYRDVVALFGPLLGSLSHEEMWVLYLSSSNRILEKRRMSVGGLSSLTTDCRPIVRHALTLVAASIIVVHNHPSGLAEPSGEDEQFTRRLREAAALFDIALLDHIIVSRGGSYSFRADGKL
jgi:DNA repair protein RadC